MRRSFRGGAQSGAALKRVNRDLTILGWQRDRDGQNKLLQINGSKDSSWYINYQSYKFNTVLEVEDMRVLWLGRVLLI